MSLVGKWLLTKDSLFSGAEKVVNGNNALDSDWPGVGTEAANVWSTEQAHSGTHSRKITLDGLGTGFAGAYQIEADLTIGNSYYCEAWYYGLDMVVSTFSFTVNNGGFVSIDSEAVSNGAWIKLSGIFVAATTTPTIYLVNGATSAFNANKSFYIDDASVKEIYFEDASGNGNNGVPVNYPTFTTNQQARADRATVFDGSTDKVTITSPAGLSSTQGAISLWARFSALGSNNDFLELKEGAFDNFLLLRKTNENKIQLFIYEGGVSKINLLIWVPLISDTNWHHILVLQDGVSAKVYIDNVLMSTVTGTNSTYWTNHITADLFTIGQSALNKMTGDICNVELYSATPTPAEIANIYNSELFWNPVALTASMNFSGSISIRNPNWLLLDDSLAWMGEWDETYTYGLYDAVLYKTGDGEEWHVFVSKTIHNTGNNPTTSPAYWRRYYQEQFL